MKYYAPSYYKDFKCIADKCKNNCCIGWEIDIDDETYADYMKLDGVFGERLKGNIEVSKEGRHFRLGENERCPFLNKNGLCDIIITLGEDSLCNICADHPRYRNFFDERVEMGLGLSCEEAARVILSNPDITQIIPICDEEEERLSEDEEYLLSVRNDLFSIITDRTKAFEERIEEIEEKYEIYISERSDLEWAEFFKSNIEYMGNEMINKLNLAREKADFSTIPETAWEQLAHYFIYRHLPDALYDDSLYERIAFCIISVKIIRLMLSGCESISLDTLIDTARLYSSEIEYSEENIDAVLDELSKYVQ